MTLRDAGTPGSIEAVDVHAHCVPAEVVDRLEAEGPRFGVEVVEEDGRRRFLMGGETMVGPLRPGLTDLPARLSAMDAAGIDVQVLSAWMDLTADTLPPDLGARYARMYNDALAATVAERPDRFLALCTLAHRSPVAAVEELQRAVRELGMVGVEIGTTVAGRDLDDEDLVPFWSVAEALQCLVLVHPAASWSGRARERFFLGNLVGNPAETTFALGHLVFGGVLERHPRLRVCVVHGGGFAPYQVGRWDHAYHHSVRGAADRLSRPPSEWVRSLLHDTVLHSPRSLRLLLDVVGAEHVVLGSDYPFEMGDPDPLHTLAAVPGLTKEDRRLIRAGNLRWLLGAVPAGD